MTQQTTSDLLKAFQAEIDKSAVLSDSFKGWLQGQMMSMATVAHKQGYNEGLKEERKAKKGKTNG
ncbi:MAG: hypothetical protein DRP83_00730 [Planctomycetota bacterium]|nr:MAG: hypothetical protein DRP83_00730 [Planctomycetota bacterium]